MQFVSCDAVQGRMQCTHTALENVIPQVLSCEPARMAYRGILHLDFAVVWNVATWFILVASIALSGLSMFLHATGPHVSASQEQSDRALFRAVVSLVLQIACLQFFNNHYPWGARKMGPLQMRFWARWFFPHFHTRKGVVDDCERLGPFYARAVVRVVYAWYGVRLCPEDSFFWKK